jgi:hypothetical protein
MIIENDVAITIRVPSTLRDRFNIACEKRGTTVSKYLRGAIENFIMVAETGDGELLAKTRIFARWADAIRGNVLECILFLEAGNRVGQFPILTKRTFWNKAKNHEEECVFCGPTESILDFVKALNEFENDEAAMKMIDLLFENARSRTERTDPRKWEREQKFVFLPEDLPYLD